jgi:hypothetical protein
MIGKGKNVRLRKTAVIGEYEGTIIIGQADSRRTFYGFDIGTSGRISRVTDSWIRSWQRILGIFPSR